MRAVIDRVMLSYDLMQPRTAATSAAARAMLATYLATLFEAGEKDFHRLAMCGLAYLRERDGSADSVRAGFTGL